MTVKVIAFTADGARLAGRLANRLQGKAWAPARYASGSVLPYESLSSWTRENFVPGNALIFVSACGIALRAMAPFIRDKAHDPAVICMDDQGRHVISLLSGHLGGANALARRAAALTGGEAVITTATDVHGVTAVDLWAKEQGCAIENIEAVKHVSASVLDGRPVGVAVTEELQPAPWPVTLWLRPKNLVLGVGCKRGASIEALRTALQDFMQTSGYSILSISAVATIDLKKDEPGLLALARELGAPLQTSTAAELAAVSGNFSRSEKVLSVTGVDNVCERSAVRCAGGPLLCCKRIYPGITFALARKPCLRF